MFPLVVCQVEQVDGGQSKGIDCLSETFICCGPRALGRSLRICNWTAIRTTFNKRLTMSRKAELVERPTKGDNADGSPGSAALLSVPQWLKVEASACAATLRL